MTVLSGAASLAPRAAPRPQPRIPGAGAPKYVPGRSNPNWDMSSPSSLMMTVLSLRTCSTQAETQALSRGLLVRPASACARNAARALACAASQAGPRSRRRAAARGPGPVAFERQNHIGLLDVRFGPARLMQTVAVREVHVRSAAVEDRQVQ